MAWDIEFTDEARDWYLSLDDRDSEAMTTAIELLEETGPALGRPAVDTVKGSRHSNMKELRSFGGHLRALFVFDPRRTAIVLIGGNKTNDWRSWYERKIPVADDLYDKYLNQIEEEGLI